MKRLLIKIIAGLLLIPAAFITWLSTTESGLHWAYQHAEIYLPAELSIQTIQGRLIGPVMLKDVEYQQDGTVVSAEHVELNWHPLALLTANISISQLHVQSLQIKLPDTKEDKAGALRLPAIHLPWRTAVSQLVIDGMVVHQAEQSFQLTKISLDATSLFSNIDIDHLGVTGQNFSVDLQGKIRASGLYKHRLKIQWQTTLPSTAVLRGSGHISGNLVNTHIQQSLSGAAVLTLEAVLKDPLHQLRWQARMEVSAFNAAQLAVDAPPLSGKLRFKASGDLNTATASGILNGVYADNDNFDASFSLQRLANNRVHIEYLCLQVPQTDTLFNAQGYWEPGNHGGEVQLALDWHNLRWPLQHSAWFNSASGIAEISGNLAHYKLSLTTDQPWPQAPPSTWHAEAEGNLDGMEFKSLRIEALNGEVVVNGKLDWSPQLAWQAEVSASNIDPASLWPQWPGKLNAAVSSRGSLENDQLLVESSIHRVSGKLRDYPVALRGRLDWRNQGLDIHQLDFTSATSQVSVQGRAGDQLKLDWRIAASNLAELYPEAKGELTALGQLTGPRDTPLVKAQFNGKGLSLAGYTAGTVKAKVTLDVMLWQQIDIQLAAQAISFQDYQLKSLEISADTRKLLATASAQSGSAQLALHGNFDGNHWRGHIQRADIQTQGFDNWQLQAPAALHISADDVLLESLCWHNSHQASVCASLKRLQDNWQSQLEMQQWPLRILQPWLPADLTLEGVVDGNADLQYTYPDQLFGQVDFRFPAGAIGYPLLEGSRDRWEYLGSTLSVTLNEQGLSSSASIDLGKGDGVSFKATLANARLLELDPQQQKLSASTQLKLHDLGLIEAVFPEAQVIKGDVTLELNASGTLARPRLQGQAKVNDGELRIPRLGLTIKQVDMLAQSDGLETMKLRIQAHSGEGKLLVQGQTRLDSSAGWPTRLTIKGEQFEASSIPEARVLVSPDLQVKLQHHTIHVTGSVDIPYAKLQPRDITMAAKVSNDAVIVGGEQTAEQPWTIISKIRLKLGERVNFYGYGFEGRLGGSLLLEDEPGQLTKATGEITIPEGRYRAYGQRLDVEHGRLLYAGSPLGNPGLDIRAVRHVNNVTAGVKVKGSLSQPQLELFSIPAMGQTDALSYLVLGRPMETSSGEEGAMVAKAALALGLSGGDRLARLMGDRFGLDEMRVESSETGDQASLVVGRYLSPKIYVSYGVGLIEAINTFTVRYQISNKWQLKAESGGEAQGADILYTIER